MKILSIGNFGHGWDGSICDEEHIAAALEDMGHEVVRHDRNEENTVPAADVDFILISQFDHYKPNMTARLKEYFKCPIVYWAFDYQAHDQPWHQMLVAESDLYLSKRIADSQFPNWRWLSQDFAPNFLQPVGNDGVQVDVLFTGTYLDWAKERNETLKAIDENFNLQIHSVNPAAWTAAGFKNVGGPVMDKDLPALIARTRINISIDHTIEAGYWSDRTAQILACGGFVLMRYVPLAEARFQQGVEFFHSTDQALVLIEEWLSRPGERSMHAFAGQDYAQTYLKVGNRVQDLLTIVEDQIL